MSLLLDLSAIPRALALRLWLQYHGVKVCEIAGGLDVDPSDVSRVMSGERSSDRIREALLRRGVPEELLPPPGRSGPGRPRKE